MSYLYYPGCSLEGTAREYDISTRALMGALEYRLIELRDWTCCGASAALATSRLLTLALPAVNLAVAEAMDSQADLLVPCSACYLNLKRVEVEVYPSRDLLTAVNTVLAEGALHLHGKTRVRHLLDVLSRDVGAERIGAGTVRPLTGLTIAPYYGCQCLRPYSGFDDPEAPVSMESLIRAAGARVHAWDMGSRCCGASHMNTKMPIAIELVAGILQEARGADAIVTVCPMCQMNLEAYQDRASSRSGRDLSITVMYLPQLLGLALGLEESALGIPKNLAVTRDFRRRAGI